jgi:hypothetical protein
LLLSYEFDGYSTIEYAAFDLAEGKARGHLDYPSGFAGGTNVTSSRAPWVLEQNADIVVRMDPAQPWVPTGSWNVATPPPDAGGYAYADPSSVAETETEAYVALYNRDDIAVLDTTHAADAGSPSKRIDLSQLLQAGDEDGSLEVSGAFYDATTKRVWLVLGNIDEDTITAPDYELECVAGLTSTVVAIDTTTDTLVSGLKYTLTGYDPTSVTFDAASGRLIIMEAGCAQKTDAGPGAISGRLIESLNLETGLSTTLYEGNSRGYPGGLLYVNQHLAFVSYGGVTYGWDPTLATLGSAITTTPDTFAWDGQGLVGPRVNYLGDGGIGSIDVIEVEPLTGTVKTIGVSPVSQPDPNGFWTGVATWSTP